MPGCHCDLGLNLPAHLFFCFLASFVVRVSQKFLGVRLAMSSDKRLEIVHGKQLVGEIEELGMAEDAESCTDERESSGGRSGTKRYRLVNDIVSSSKRLMSPDKTKRKWSQFNDNYSLYLEWKLSMEKMKFALMKEKLQWLVEKTRQKEKLKNENKRQLMELRKMSPKLIGKDKSYVDQMIAQIESDDLSLALV